LADPQEKLQTENLSDYHCHCDYSIDATGTVDEYCEAAITKGLVEICFTTHYDPNPNSIGGPDPILVNGKQVPPTPDNLSQYVDDVHKAADKFYKQELVVKLGLEFGWYSGCEEGVELLKQRFNFDHMLCGIHEIDNICFCCKSRFEQCFSRYKSVDHVVDAYIVELVNAIQINQFDCIAHLDYLKKYSSELYGSELDRVLLEQMKEQVFPALVATDTAIEINTSGMRRNLDTYFPSIKLANAARRAGVRIDFLGSDAHQPEDVGADFDMAAILVESAIRYDFD